MEHEEALSRLQSPNAHTRLIAARSLYHVATANDLGALKEARQDETVTWIINALDKAIAGIGEHRRINGEADSHDPPDVPPSDVSPDEIAAQSRAIAVEETTSQLTHELEPLLGAMRRAGAREVANYENSKTKKLHDRFDSLLEAISILSKSTSIPKYVEFDLAELLHDLIVELVAERDIGVDEIGQSPFIVQGDPNLIAIIFRNGFSNALEATLSSGSPPYPQVVTIWDKTDRDIWVAILDRGQGLPDTYTRMWDMGSTTKVNHLGMGLPLARSAIESLGGKINLGPRQDGGARFEFRWPISIEVPE